MRRAFGTAVLLIVFCLALAGCASQPPAAPAEPSDPKLESSWRLARYALENGQYRQATVLYERALSLAYARDDAEAIGNIGYEHALALLRGGEPETAAEQAARVRWELQRRNVAPFADLFLVEAVAHYESGAPGAARDAALTAVDLAGPDAADTRGRAHFILGMLAADNGDRVGLDRAISALGHPSQEALQADLGELQGRRLLLDGDTAAAQTAFEKAAALRRELRDYSGMARGLAAAGAAAESRGDPVAAADLYYRAGLSATEQEDTPRAQDWLSKAVALAAENGLAGIEADARAHLLSLAE